MMYNSPENVDSHHPRTPYPLAHPNPNPQPLMVPLPPPLSTPPFSGGGSVDEFSRREERLSHQWSYQETIDFIEIRAQLEWDFSTSRRNKNLWEMVANGMREKGYRRTGEQCKCKWKNLVTRYKAQGTYDQENYDQSPFFEELHAYFAARDYVMQQPHLDFETVPTNLGKRLENVSVDQSPEELCQQQGNIAEVTEVEQVENITVAPKRKSRKLKRQKTEKNVVFEDIDKIEKSVVASFQETLTSFMEQQQRIDMLWKEAIERRTQERDVFEQEWRQTMEKLEREKIMMQEVWREREEQSRLREEKRAEKRDALLNTLLNKLIHDENL